jgi:hypothetical protein
VVFQEDFHLLPTVKRSLKPDAKLVLYYREAHRTWPSLDGQGTVDFEIGVHHSSYIINPSFLQPPAGLLSRTHNAQKRENFAIFVASDCDTKSFREEYLAELVKVLGEDRVDRFGACFNKRLPGHSIEAFEQIVSQYKFYFSFENTIQVCFHTSFNVRV